MRGDYEGVQTVERYPRFFVPAAENRARLIQWLPSSPYSLGTRAEGTAGGKVHPRTGHEGHEMQ